MSHVKYHISPVSGNPTICHAIVRKCPLGENVEHYLSLASARSAFEEKMITAISTNFDKPYVLEDEIDFRSVEVDSLREEKKTTFLEDLKILNVLIHGKNVHIAKLKRDLHDRDRRLAGEYFDKNVSSSLGNISMDRLAFKKRNYVEDMLSNPRTVIHLREMDSEA